MTSSEFKHNEIETFINFLLDTETTSEIVFNEKLTDNKDFYQEKYRSIFETIIDKKFQLWNQFCQNEQRILEDRIATNNSKEPIRSSDNDDDDDDELDFEEDSSSDENKQRSKVKEKQQVDRQKNSTLTSIHLVNVNDFFNFYITVIRHILVCLNFTFVHSNVVQSIVMKNSVLLASNKSFNIFTMIVKIINV